MITYIGNGRYCYANGLAMLIATIGDYVAPARLEVLTGVGLGAVWHDHAKIVFFNNIVSMPDRGISKVLDLLGYKYTELVKDEMDDAPFDELRSNLRHHPVLLGPLDMGYLTYNPSHEDAAGADHYVMAYAMDDHEVYVHDPEGYPCVHLSLDHLEPAWRAERVPYHRGVFRCWLAPQRVHQPSEDDIYSQSITFFQSLYRETAVFAAENQLTIGQEAILLLADHVRNGAFTPREFGHMVHFTFPLGARRALDFASFFRHPELSVAKYGQAGLFGSCQTLALRKHWSLLADTLQELAAAEEDFRCRLLAL
jgi:hypothetical protein